MLTKGTISQNCLYIWSSQVCVSDGTKKFVQQTQGFNDSVIADSNSLTQSVANKESIIKGVANTHFAHTISPQLFTSV